MKNKIALSLIILFLAQMTVFAVGLKVGVAAPDFKVMSGDGTVLTLNMLKGQVVALFYDNKDAVEKSRKLKNALQALTKGQEAKKVPLAGVPVIDCTGAFFPFVGVWKQQLVINSKKERLTIYGDWDGKMKTAYQVEDKDTHFFLIDKSGVIKYAVTGPVDDKTVATIVQAIQPLLN